MLAKKFLHLFWPVYFLLLVTLFLPTSAKKTFAQENNSYITIVNPVRISEYTRNPSESLLSEYNVVREKSLPATWLLTYDAIINDSVWKVTKEMDERQELGIFLEVTENFAKKTDVLYNKTDGWQRATSLFLSGYGQEDRKKLIDLVFSSFRERFGYYPKSVGGWWVDSYSLNYMKEKYEITGVLGISDQYDLDGYSVWGTFWSTPFYPSKIHAGVPASSLENKLDIVTFRWAARDPLNGYLNDKLNPALFSIQDYPMTGEGISYLQKLMKIYAIKRNYNNFGHLTIGLEADYAPNVYKDIYSLYLDTALRLKEDRISFLNMEDFSEWYLNQFEISPSHIIETEDLLGGKKKSIWVQNSLYRVGLVYDSENLKTKLIDLRVYPQNFPEPFYNSPNMQYDLQIKIPYVIDSVIEKGSAWELDLGRLLEIRKEKDIIFIIFEKGIIDFSEKEIDIPKIPLTQKIRDSKQVKVEGTAYGYSIVPYDDFYIPSDGLLVSELSFRIPFSIRSRIESYVPLVLLALLAAPLLVTKSKKIRNSLLPISLVFLVILGGFVIYKAGSKYYVNQSEIDGLNVLRSLPSGRVLVYDKDCLRCKFATSYKPSASQGLKGYVRKISGKDTVLDYSFITAKNSRKASEVLRKMGIKYIYLAKYEEYIESLPYLPEDLEVSKIYENANSVIWQVGQSKDSW